MLNRKDKSAESSFLEFPPVFLIIKIRLKEILTKSKLTISIKGIWFFGLRYKNGTKSEKTDEYSGSAVG